MAKYNNYKKYNNGGRNGKSKRQSMRNAEQRQANYIAYNDTMSENSIVMKYIKDNNVTIEELAQELKTTEQEINRQFMFSMTPQRIVKYCNAVDRIKKNKSMA